MENNTTHLVPELNYGGRMQSAKHVLGHVLLGSKDLVPNRLRFLNVSQHHIERFTCVFS